MFVLTIVFKLCLISSMREFTPLSFIFSIIFLNNFMILLRVVFIIIIFFFGRKRRIIFILMTIGEEGLREYALSDKKNVFVAVHNQLSVFVFSKPLVYGFYHFHSNLIRNKINEILWCMLIKIWESIATTWFIFRQLLLSNNIVG